MPTIDLTLTPPSAPGLLHGLPRRVALTLPELILAAGAAGGAPLPFEIADRPAGALEDRLGQGRDSAEDAARAAALAALHDPAETLGRRGLLVDGRLAEGPAGALGLLATPRLALDVDLAVGRTRAKAWHRSAGGALATLSTIDGIVFELTWCATEHWPAEIARIPVLPEEVRLHPTILPDSLCLPYELVDAAGEAVQSGRSDLLPVLASHHAGRVQDDTGRPLSEVELTAALAAVVIDARGRLRVLAADVSGEETTEVGVVSWVLLADGWRALRPQAGVEHPLVELRAVRPGDLAVELAGVLVEVAR